MNTIPIYISTRDQLTTTREMVEYLLQIPEVKPIILDIASTYPPLLDWYDYCPVEVIYVNKNLGPRALWKRGTDVRDYSYFGLTDADLDLSDVPLDCIQVLCDGLDRYPDILKCGLSLEIDNLPNTTVAKRAWDHEIQFWQKRHDELFFSADIDCSFAVYRSSRPQWGYGPSLRADKPYTARHRPWYLTPDNITEEDYYYWKHCDPGISNWGEVVQNEYGLVMP